MRTCRAPGVGKQKGRGGVSGPPRSKGWGWTARANVLHTENRFFNQVCFKTIASAFLQRGVNSLTTTLASRLAQTMKARAHEKVDAAAAAHQRHVSRVDLVEQKAASRCVFSAFHLIHTPHCCRPLLPLSLHRCCAQSASPWTSAPSFASLAAPRLRSARLHDHRRTSTATHFEAA